MQHRPDHRGAPAARGRRSTSTSRARRTSSATSAGQVARQLSASTEALGAAHARRRRLGARCAPGSARHARHLRPLRARVPRLPGGRRERRRGGRRIRAIGRADRRADPLADRGTDAPAAPARPRDPARCSSACSRTHDIGPASCARPAPGRSPRPASATRWPTSSTARCSASGPTSTSTRPPGSGRRSFSSARRSATLFAHDRSAAGADRGRSPDAGGADRGGARGVRGTRLPRDARQRPRGGGGRFPRSLLPVLREQGRAGAHPRGPGDADGLARSSPRSRRSRRPTARPAARCCAGGCAATTPRRPTRRRCSASGSTPRSRTRRCAQARLRRSTGADASWPRSSSGAGSETSTRRAS